MNTPVLDYHKPHLKRSNAGIILLDLVVTGLVYVSPLVLNKVYYRTERSDLTADIQAYQHFFNQCLIVVTVACVTLTIFSMSTLPYLGKALLWNMKTRGGQGSGFFVCRVLWLVHAISMFGVFLTLSQQMHIGDGLDLLFAASLAAAVLWQLACALSAFVKGRRAQQFS